MSFNHWFKNILGDSLVSNVLQEPEKNNSTLEHNNDMNMKPKEEIVHEEEIIDLQKEYEEKMNTLLNAAKNKKNKNKSYANDIEEFAQVKRDLMVKNVKQKIQKYDNEKFINDPKKYKKFFDQSKKSDNPEVDKALDIILEKKLDVFDGIEKNTEESQKQLEKQKEEYEKRQKEYSDRVSLIKNSIKNYDSEKKKDNDQYKTFDEVCLDSDWDDVDEDMHINLQERLDVYDETKESEKTRIRRMQKNEKIDQLLKKYDEEKIRRH